MSYTIYYQNIDKELAKKVDKAQSDLKNYKTLVNTIIEKSVPNTNTLNGYYEKLSELQKKYEDASFELRKMIPEDLYFQASNHGIKYQWYTAIIYGYLCIEIADLDKVAPEEQAWVEKLMADNGFTKKE